ncbi:unnamed protein product [Pleuronectes platessa]|uniref:Mu-type opioid receptor n=1 Tax=Pleuronectes platessa TaxID=8262 RepID=A0A9N7YZR7_PLEPL|nr:unnamed protein product [Pleuronectes platessa]
MWCIQIRPFIYYHPPNAYPLRVRGELETLGGGGASWTGHQSITASTTTTAPSVNRVSRRLSYPSRAATFFHTVKCHVSPAPPHRAPPASSPGTTSILTGHHQQPCRAPPPPEGRPKTHSISRSPPNTLTGLKEPTMEGAGNGTGADYRSQLPGLYNSSGGLCGNFTSGNNNNTMSFSEVRCDGEHRGGDTDANPVIIAIVITALYSIVCVVGLVGNVLIMYIIVR